MSDSSVPNLDQNLAPPGIPAASPNRRVNTILWRILILPSLLILAISIGAYFSLPLRDAFMSGQSRGPYLPYAIYSTASPYFYTGGGAAVLFGFMFLFSIVRTISRREWVYWQRLIGLIALTASGVILFITGSTEFGSSSRDAGWVTYGGYDYHLFVQTLPAAPGTDLRMSIFVCDSSGLTCQRFHRADLEYQTGERVPQLDLMRIEVDGIFVVVRSNSPTILTKIQP